MGCRGLREFTIFLLFLLPSETFATELLLHCTSNGGVGNYFLLNPERNTVERVDMEPSISGDLKVSENFYILSFKGSETTWPLRVEVNRYSGKFEWEHGNDEFGQFSMENVFRVGVCAKEKAEKKF